MTVGLGRIIAEAAEYIDADFFGTGKIWVRFVSRKNFVALNCRLPASRNRLNSV